MRVCPFCGDSEGPFTREHWLPEDWGDYFPRINGLITQNHDYDGESTRRIENLSQFDKKFDGICARCNNVWLRDIDVEAKRVALDLAFRRRLYVSANEVRPLAASLYRAALVGMWGQRLQHGLPSRRYPEFRRLRRPPSDVYLLLGHNDAGYIFAGGHYSAVTVDGDTSLAVRSFSFGGLGHLFVVVLVTEPELSSTMQRVAREVKRQAQGTLTTLWPNSRQRVNLPTRQISYELAAQVAEVGVVLNLRPPRTAPPDDQDLRRRFASKDGFLKNFRPATKRLE